MGETGTGGGLGAFLSSAPRVIGSITALIGAVTGLLIALNKVGWLDGDSPKPEDADSVFGTLEREPIGRVYFDGKTMYVKASTPNNPLVHLAKLDDPLHDVSMNARVRWFSGAKDYGVSFICRYQSPANYYVLAVLSGPRLQHRQVPQQEADLPNRRHQADRCRERRREPDHRQMRRRSADHPHAPGEWADHRYGQG